MREHNYRYYVLAQPIISDYEFDMLLEELIRLEKQYPELLDPDSPSQKVGGEITKSFETVKHKYPMLSLGNTYSEEELAEFDTRVKKGLGTDDYAYVCELKFDGFAIGIQYKEGKFHRAITRGDGVKGDDVSVNVKTIKSIPLQLKGDYPDEFEIRGEVFMHRAALGESRERRPRAEARIVSPTCDRRGVWRGEAPRCSVFAAETEAPAQIDGTGLWTGDLVILADRGSGSATEDYIAWLLDNGIAKVAGERTNGAGCGYVNGGNPTYLKVAPLVVHMPNCARFRKDGTNEVEGIMPTIPIALSQMDETGQKAALARLLESMAR